VLIYACVSAHGFGHGSRTASVLEALHRLEPSWTLVVSTALPDRFLDVALAGVPHLRRRCRWDVGVIQADALGGDAAATLVALEQLERQLPEQLAGERAWLSQQPGPRLVLGDVPPATADLARAVGAPLVWLASFGWDEIYGPMGAPFAGAAAEALARYRQGDLLLHCPLAMAMPWGLKEVHVGLTASSPRLAPEALRQQLRLPAERQQVVLISFGGLGLELDPALLERWPGFIFVGTDPALARVANGRVLPEGLRPLDAMPCCGRVITKPGYSTFSEALSQGLGIHLVHREGFAEAVVLERALVRHAPHRLLSQAQLRSGDWQLDQPLLPGSDQPLPANGADQAAVALRQFAAPFLQQT
jgi:hypothetical protein